MISALVTRAGSQQSDFALARAYLEYIIMKNTPRLTAGLIALFCFAAGLVGFNFYARAQEQKYIGALAPLNITEILYGSALQRAALGQPDLLTVIGSSEVVYVDTPYEANRFFKNLPTGFAVVDVARVGASSLTMAQDLAALGGDLRGKKIVISLAPGDFFLRGLHQNFYVGNYSRLHAYEMVFSPYLSMDLKRAAAKNMLDFEPIYNNDPFLHFALIKLANASPQQHLLYDLAWPLGELQIAIMNLQDHANVIAYLRANPTPPNAAHNPQAIDWADLLKTARAQEARHTRHNPYGVAAGAWWYYQQKLMRDPLPGSGNSSFVQNLVDDHEWSNLKILLDVLQQLGAKPLILSRPMNVRLWEAMGVSEKAQDVYYTKLHQVVDPYHFPLVDFQSQGNDIYFSIDAGSHTSPEGWIYVDQVLDAYYHGRLP